MSQTCGDTAACFLPGLIKVNLIIGDLRYNDHITVTQS